MYYHIAILQKGSFLIQFIQLNMQSVISLYEIIARGAI